ncbi:MAG: anthranilate phosphoribosyltransferase [Acidimicrobiia bacterium]|nr:anthranilate phosphoribosyltransferase [Acidimicrobiia bacterium]
MGGWAYILDRLTGGHDLTTAEASAVMADILGGAATPPQIAAFLVALRMKGPSVGEVVGLTEAMVDAAAPIQLPAAARAVDIVGTGGSPSRRGSALNVSTMACFAAAGAGAIVCKHGNRRASSTSGGFDLLEALGVAVEADGEAVAACVEQVGLGFCFARSFHPAMRHAAPVRADLGIPTVFNLIGPLCHPARVSRQVIGVASADTAELVAGVLAARSVPLAWVVHGDGDLDELALTGPTVVREVRDGSVRAFEVHPGDVGLAAVAPDELRGGTPEDNAVIAHRVLNGAPGPATDIVALNAGAALVVAEVADDLADGVAQARAALADGRAAAKLAALVART